MILNIMIGAFISFIIGMVVGCIIHYYTGEPKCNHQFEKILDEVIYEDTVAKNRVVVHMCKKCGKRKITRV